MFKGVSELPEYIHHFIKYFFQELTVIYSLLLA